MVSEVTSRKCYYILRFGQLHYRLIISVPKPSIWILLEALGFRRRNFGVLKDPLRETRAPPVKGGPMFMEIDNLYEKAILILTNLFCHD